MTKSGLRRADSVSLSMERNAIQEALKEVEASCNEAFLLDYARQIIEGPNGESGQKIEDMQDVVSAVTDDFKNGFFYAIEKLREVLNLPPADSEVPSGSAS